MALLSNMRITTRLAAGFTIVLALSVVATGYGLVQARASAEATKQMMARPLAKERLVSDWYVLIYSAIARTALFARTSDEQLPVVFKDVVADSVTRGSELIKKIDALLENDEEKALFKNIVAMRNKYQDAKNKVMDAKKAGKADEAERAFQEQFTPTADAYQKGVMLLLQQQRKAIDDTCLLYTSPSPRDS